MIVVIESPYRDCMTRGLNRLENYAYGKACLLDSLKRNESPFAGHLLYTEVLDDDEEWQRLTGIRAHLEYVEKCDLVAFYIDLGMSPGMEVAMERVRAFGVAYEQRTIGWC